MIFFIELSDSGGKKHKVAKPRKKYPWTTRKKKEMTKQDKKRKPKIENYKTGEEGLRIFELHKKGKTIISAVC